MNSPSGRVPERDPEMFLMATQAYGDGTLELGFFSGVSIFIGIFGARNKSGGLRGGHEVGGRTQGVERAPHSRGCLGNLLAHLRYSVGFFWSKNNLREISGELDSIWFPFLRYSETRKK